jgi:hypothetical protein
MIDKEDITLFKVWANEGSIFYDEYSQTFMLGTHNDLGESEFYRIMPELTGLFSPVTFGDSERYSFCYGQLDKNNTSVSRFKPEAAKLLIVISFSYFNYEHHKNNLLTAISFSSFHHKNSFENQAHHIDDAIAQAKILNQEGRVNDETTLKAAVLENIVSGTHVKFESIEMFFGKDVREIVEVLTNINSHNDMSAEALLKEFSGASDSTKQVQLAIILTNLKYTVTQTAEKRKINLSWRDELAKVCEGASADLSHIYKIERSKLN